MEYKMGSNFILLRLDPGNEMVACVKNAAAAENISLGSVSGIGAVNHVVLGCFLPKEKQYVSHITDTDMEILSLSGNISRMDGEVYVHLHMAAADKNGKTYGGHLNEARVSATAEIMINILDGGAGRRFSDEIGLNILDFEV